MNFLRNIPTRLNQINLKRLLLVIVALGAFLFVFFIGAYEVVHYTESTPFCISCHNVMNPEATTHQISPHANTDCGTCHIGPGIINKFANKFRSIRYLWYYPLEIYEKPLPSPPTTLRPAQVVCEQCHWPEIFYPVRIMTLYDYAQDKANSLTQVVLPLRVGSGEEVPEDYGPGIHWHIQNPVYYITTDYERQHIPWVQVEIDGEIHEYLAVDSTLTQAEIDQAEKRRMDCMDCHNRATHVVPKPSDAIDEAMASGAISPDLPYIKKQAALVLDEKYESDNEALVAIEQIADFYRDEYPEVYAERISDIESAIERLKTIYSRSHFNYMNVYWDTYPDNIGHTDSAGCYRCHDGKHLTADNQPIQLQCNLCHYVPQVSEPGASLIPVDLEMPSLPDSHEDPFWMAKHRYLFDESCTECHEINNPAGADNSGFCSNSACHGREWEYLDFEVATLRELVAPTSEPTGEEMPIIPHPALGNCLNCHGLDEIHPFPEYHTGYTLETCTACHRPAGEAVQPSSTTPRATPTPDVPAPQIAHMLEGQENCQQCHNPESNIAPAPQNHSGYTNDVCLACHALPAATPTPEPMAQATTTPEDTETAPIVSHGLDETYENCRQCHDPNGNIKPAPQNHTGYSNDTCLACHQLSE